MSELSTYLDERCRREVVDEIRYLELPPEWKPSQVIKYIVRIIEKHNG